MLVKEFITELKKLPENATIDYGNSFYRNNQNQSIYDIDLYDLFLSGTFNKKEQITLWMEE